MILELFCSNFTACILFIIALIKDLSFIIKCLYAHAETFCHPTLLHVMICSMPMVWEDCKLPQGKDPTCCAQYFIISVWHRVWFTMGDFPCSVAQSCLSLFTLWTVAQQAPLSLEFSRQEYWSRLPFPPPGDLSNSGIEPTSSILTGSLFSHEPPGKPLEWVPNTSLLHKRMRNLASE